MSDIEEGEIDKKKIYADEKKFFVDWIKAICEKPLSEVQSIAEKYITDGSVTSLTSLFSELNDGKGHYSIHFAVSRNHRDTADWILGIDKKSIDYLDEDGFSPLVHAVIGDLNDMAEFLIVKGASVNPLEGVPPLNMACDKSNETMVQLLLDHGADVNWVTTMSNGSSLHHACAHNRNDLIPMLLDHGAKIDETDAQGVSPLLYATVNTNATAIRILLKRGANPLISLMDGTTPLHIACESGHMDSVKAFMNHPSIAQTANQHNKNGQLPISLAVDANQLLVVDAMRSLTAECDGLSLEDVMEQFASAPKEEAAPEHVKEEPRLIPAIDSEIVRRKKVEGVELFNKEKYAEAADIFTNAMNISPNDEVLYSNRSSCYLRMGDTENAMKDARQCIALSPNWSKGYYRLGMVFFEKGEYVDAATSFYQGCENDPKDKKLSDMFQQSVAKGKEEFAKEKSLESKDDSS